jgi:hypothetical protein
MFYLSMGTAQQYNFAHERLAGRTLSKVPTLAENCADSAGAKAHARYIVENYLSGNRHALAGSKMHTEDPRNSWYTSAGKAAAQRGDISTGTEESSPAQVVDGLMAVPFHRVTMLDPHIRRVAYGDYCRGRLCSGVFVISSPDRPKVMRVSYGQFPSAIEFPPDQAVLPLTWSVLGEGEWPDPLSGCPGYAQPAGQAITLQFDSRFIPQLLSFEIKRDGTAVEACGFDSSSYTNPINSVQIWGRNGLKGFAAIALIPRAPLMAGTIYTVTVSVEGERNPYPFDGPWSALAGQIRTFTWSFSAGR